MTPPPKDPVSPAHKRFVLGQARLRLVVMALVAAALVALLVVEL